LTGEVGEENKREILHIDTGFDEECPMIELDNCPQKNLPEAGGRITIDYSFTAVYSIRDKDAETRRDKPFIADRLVVDPLDGKALVRPFKLSEMRKFFEFYYGYNLLPHYADDNFNIPSMLKYSPRDITAKIYVGNEIYYKGPIICHNTTFPLFIRKDPRGGDRNKVMVPSGGGLAKIVS
jgi:hypothetical protein